MTDNKAKQSQKQQDAEKAIVKSITDDFAARQEMRRPYEAAWQMNVNFVMGNQYCRVGNRGTVEQEEKFYYWQEKQVFNRIAPLVETRISRLNRVRPRPVVRPFGSDEKAENAAKLSTAVLDAARERLRLSDLISQAVMWSEVCGTAFYKIVWDESISDVSVCVCSPFEIYPDSNVAENLDDCHSIIHAKCYSAEEVERIWGVKAQGSDVKVFDTGGATVGGGFGYNSLVPSVTQQTKSNQVLVLERYEKPTVACPQGKLQIVAGDKLVVNCPLPYAVGDNGEPSFPFVRQISLARPGCFWGASVVDRLIPVQRAYNAVKNRKHEFLNRIAMGVLAVEDGSVDVDDLEEEGLSPGKIIVYRRGATMPKLMDGGDVPQAFADEEAKLSEEFVAVSGVSEFAVGSSAPSNIKSGVALQLIAEQDELRISSGIDSIKSCVMLVAKCILRLYKQYVTATKLMRLVGSDSRAEVKGFVGSDLSADDITFQTDNESSDTPATRRSMLFDLISAGVLTDENGKMNSEVKQKILQIMGFENLVC